MKDEKFVDSELLVKATAAVEESVKKDLEVADPEKEKAKAIIDENTQRDDGNRSS
jgi:hypothetical protein